MYCKKCGGKLESYASNCAFCGEPVEKYDTKVNYIKEEKVLPKHMGICKWLGLFLLLLIPALGPFVYSCLMIKWSRKKNPDLTLRGYAKANLFLMLIGFLVIVGLVVFVLLNPETFKWFEELFEQIKELIVK